MGLFLCLMQNTSLRYAMLPVMRHTDDAGVISYTHTRWMVLFVCVGGWVGGVGWGGKQKCAHLCMFARVGLRAELGEV